MLQRAAVNGVDLEYELVRSRGTRRPHPLGRGREMGRAAPGAASTDQPLPAAPVPPGWLRRQRSARRPAHHGRARCPLPPADGRARHHQGPHRRPLFQRPGSTPARAGRPRGRAHAHPHGGRAGRPAYRYPAAVRQRRRPGRRPALDRGMPGAFEQAVVDADAFFTQEMPALQQWLFTQHDARRIHQPALAVLGTASPPMFAERQRLLLQWLPKAEPLELPDLTHLLHGQNPTLVAKGLAGFFTCRPIPESL